MSLLLTHGANVNSTCKNGFTPLHLAVKMKTVEIAESLLKANAPPDAVSRNEYSPLHLASLEGCLDIVKMLVDDYGADYTLKANVGCGVGFGIVKSQMRCVIDCSDLLSTLNI